MAKEVEVTTFGLICPFCVADLKVRVRRLPGVQKVKFDSRRKQLIVTVQDGEVVPLDEIRGLVRASGLTERNILLTVRGQVIDSNEGLKIQVPQTGREFLLLERQEELGTAGLLSRETQESLRRFLKEKQLIQIDGILHEHPASPPGLMILIYEAI